MAVLKAKKNNHHYGSKEKDGIILKTPLRSKFPIIRKISVAMLLALLWILPYAGSNSFAKSIFFEEYQVKAAFLYNLANFVSWPPAKFESKDSPFKICIIGEDPFGNFLDKLLQEERIKGRRILIERIKNTGNLDTCHILFISSSMKKQMARILKGAGNKGILTVGDVEKFIDLGGMVNLVRKGSQIHLEINIDLVKGAGLEISSKLLHLAKIVKGKQSQE